jgi:hypothetical protein
MTLRLEVLDQQALLRALSSSVNTLECDKGSALQSFAAVFLCFGHPQAAFYHSSACSFGPCGAGSSNDKF